MTSSCMSKFRFRMNISHSICDPKNYEKVRTLKDNLFIIIWPIYVILTVMIPKLLYFIWWKYEQGNKYLQNCNFHDSLRTYVSNIKDKVFIFFYRSTSCITFLYQIFILIQFCTGDDLACIWNCFNGPDHILIIKIVQMSRHFLRHNQWSE